MAAVVPVISAIGTLAAGVAAITSAFRSPRIRVPQMPTFKIPDIELKSLEQQIRANEAISEQARAAAVAALRNYNAGILSPAYEAQLRRDEDLIRKYYEQQAFARGFSPGSSEYQRLMLQAEQDIATRRSQYLQQQLQDALTLSGLSESTIRQMIAKWQAQAGTYQTALAGWESAMDISLARQLLTGQMLGAGLAQTGKAIEDIVKKVPSRPGVFQPIQTGPTLEDILSGRAV